MTNSLQDLLSTLFGIWREVAEETIRCLGAEKAGHFVLVYNDASVIRDAILARYPRDHLLNSLVFANFIGLPKELHWFQALFLCGNYPLILSRLRFIWENIFRAHYADNFAANHPDEADLPGSSLDDKAAWLEQRDERLNWRHCIQPTLCQLFPLAAQEQEVRDQYHALWQGLNRYVHPSRALLEKLVGPSALQVKDAFDGELALETIDAATKVCELIWLAVLTNFPDAIELVAQEGLSVQYPILGTALINCA